MTKRNSKVLVPGTDEALHRFRRQAIAEEAGTVYPSEYNEKHEIAQILDIPLSDTGNPKNTE